MAWERVFQASLSGLLAILPAAADAGVRHGDATIAVDTARSHIGFAIRTRYGQRLEGHFPRFAGQVDTLPDGRQRITVTLDAGSADIPGHPRYTRWMRGGDFFDAGAHPRIVFQSEPHSPHLGMTGGTVDGWLTLRGVRAPLRMQVSPAGCARPGYDCAVTGKGEVSRTAHGMERWQLAVGDRVTFVLKVRLLDAGSR